MRDAHNNDDDRRLSELVDLAEDPDPDMPGRVHRSINRTLLAGDVLELSYSGLLATTLNYLRVALESVRFGLPDRKER